jgi:[acyl-carrier-protein] S-malonyltransferase
VPVVCNIDALPVATGEAARDALGRQVDGPVRWVESVRWMAGPGGISTFVEVGPGNVLVGLIRRISPGARCVSLAEPAALAELEA